MYMILKLRNLKNSPDFSKGKQRLAEFSPKGDKVAFGKRKQHLYNRFKH